MTSPHTHTSIVPGASGPLVALCTGHRCEALHRLADDQTGTDRVRTTIVSGRGAVLVSAPCLGACANGAVAAVARRDGVTGTTGPSVWLGGVDRPAILDALLGWIRGGGPLPGEMPANDVPLLLQDAVLGVGKPIQAHPNKR
ncbi:MULTISPECIES: (2Fe-2S) ferredoxin domain-containing protein [unclassified Cryobacterium]|uniref:(2Fe-2S) ferredoxin domain-containing protein n=1 Tax=unclassified Cryobacterium TaxID=2649013 RepID=UPI000CE4DB2B|nr:MULTISPECIES: (2Fe-2S) ferredoxin domain-containing protein [unclassified Cryobacterium]TFD64810.1 (2Fe-2S) ferredoxin domain-containing protein [Cryobacterium sp. Hh38]